MKKQHLTFTIRGKWYIVNSKGEMTQAKYFHKLGSDAFSGRWKLAGVSYHHWRKGIDTTFSEIWDDPKKAMDGLLWDLDHGTLRQWGGSYCGRLPRISSIY